MVLSVQSPVSICAEPRLIIVIGGHGKNLTARYMLNSSPIYVLLIPMHAAACISQEEFVYMLRPSSSLAPPLTLTIRLTARAFQAKVGLPATSRRCRTAFRRTARPAAHLRMKAAATPPPPSPLPVCSPPPAPIAPTCGWQRISRKRARVCSQRRRLRPRARMCSWGTQKHQSVAHPQPLAVQREQQRARRVR
jgi:hypothetical protein